MRKSGEWAIEQLSPLLLERRQRQLAAHLRGSLIRDCCFVSTKRGQVMRTIRTAKLLLAAVLAAGVASCDKPGQDKPEQVDEAAVKQALSAVEAGWNQAFHARNLDALVAPYASNAVLVLPGLPAQVGTAAIRNVYVGALKDPAFDLTLTSDRAEVGRSGELAFTQGHFTMQGTDPKTKQATTTATGSYVTIYRKQADGSWKAIQDWAAANPPIAQVR